MKRGYGHIQAPRDPRDWHISGLLGAPGDLPSVVDLSPKIDAIRDQQQTSSCVAFAFARAIQLRGAVAGQPTSYPSELAIYAFGRSQPLSDEGSIPREVAAALITYGVVPNARWPFDPNNVNVIPPWDVEQHGADARVTGYYWIDDEAVDRVAQVKHALASGFPVTFAQQVAQDFEDYTSGILGVSSLPILGGHDTTIVGYDANEGSYLAVNSWGLSFGEPRGGFSGGFFRISEERLTSPICTDFCVLTVSPKGES